MSVLQIVCQNCGAKYKLPESFQGDKAKCKACGAVIDVAAQRGGGTPAAPSKPASAKPAAVKPASAKPAAARPARAAAGSRSGSSKAATGAASGGTSRRAAGATGSARSGRAAGGRRGAADAEPKKKGNPALLIGWVIVVVAIVVGILMSGGDDPKPNETQTAQGAETAKAAEGNGGGNAAKAAENTPPENTSATEPTPAVESTTPPADETPKEVPAPKPEPAKSTPAPAKTEITTRADVYDPKTLDPLEYPAEVDAALQSEIGELLQDMADGGVSGIRAKGRLEEIGWPALFGIINHLRTIDYFDSSESMSAYELNRLLEAMAVGINVGYRPPQIGEEQSLEDVDWNAKTVKAWIRLPTKYPTPEDFDRLRQNRQTRNQGR